MKDEYYYSRLGTDEYCYPGSKVLINKFDIRDGESLATVERNITFVKSVELEKEPLRGRYGFRHLCAIHRYLFCDIYDWAGEIRRGEFLIKSDTVFCRGQFIEQYADNVFSKLKDEKLLRGLKKEAFINRLAYYMGEVNALHPFREGNGRSCRAFFTILAKAAGYMLDFHTIQPDDLLEADIKAFDKNYEPLVSILDRIVNER